MRVQALIHAPFENLGIIGSWLNQKGYTVYETHSYRGDQLPQVDSFDWLISMGGSQNLKELHRYPYLQAECDLIAKSIESNKPVLGVCLGAQLIGESLGANTVASPEKEIGVFPLYLTPEAYEDPIFRHFPKEFPVTHWHNDMPGLPQGAVVLAKSIGCPRQIIRFRPQVYGLQCHLEFTYEDIASMCVHEANDLTSGKCIQTKVELLEQDYAAINELLFVFLDHFTKEHIRTCS